MSGTTLKLGDGFAKFHPERSTQVKELQGLLRKWGYDISETGHFDWVTDRAVIHFQTAMHLNADAKVSVGAGKTWQALQKPVPPTLPGLSFSPVDVDPVPFIHQFDEVHVPGWGPTGCFAASETMLRAVGVKQAGAANKFQIITSETWNAGVPTQTIDAAALKDGLAYLDAQLAKGTPVMVGVSYSDGHHNEGITEHFVVTYEKEGEGTYRFHDPATKDASDGAERTFTTDPATKNLTVAGIPGLGQWAVGRRYYVTMIRKNEE